MARDLRLLVLVYDADPERGSESAAGWGMLRSLGRFADCVAVVGDHRYAAVRHWAETHEDHGLRVLRVPETRVERGFRRAAELHRQAEFVSYLAYLRGFRHMAERLVVREPFDAVVHAGYGVYWLPSPVSELGLPSVWGPQGGAVRIPPGLRGCVGRAGRIEDRERRLLTGSLAALPATRRAREDATVRLVENPETAAAIAPLSSEVLNRVLFAPVPEDGARPPRQPYLLFPSSLHPRKGARLVVEALARTRSDVEVRFVAEGEDRSNLEQLAARLGVSDRARFLGRVARDDYFRMVTEAAAVLFTGLREEGGAALTEAMRLGAPVIVLDHGGAGWIAHQSTDPGRARLVAPTDHDATVAGLADAMQAAVADPPSATTSHLDTEAHHARLEELVRRAAAGAPVHG